MSYRDAETIAARAKLAGVPFQTELLASGAVNETRLYHALARHLGLGFVRQIRPVRLLMRQHHCLTALRQLGGPHSAAAFDDKGRTLLLIAPARLDIAAMKAYLERYPRIAQNMRLVTPSVLRRAVSGRARESLTRIATLGLFEAMPQFSARFVVNAWQGATLGALAVAIPTGLVLWPWASILVLHLVFSLAFLACICLRLAAAKGVLQAPPPALLKAVRTEDMPVYTVLVALYKEAEIVPDLLIALGRLIWPRSKLEIKLVCESDDHETLEAIRAQELRPYIQVVEVPPQGPRTKPKALCYALPMTTGEFLVLYDAEDRPHPLQLVEAWQRFLQEDEDLACLQAPLTISNRRESWISSMFAFEYSALFNGLLPWLARRGFVLPLGGTSNHFRRAILERVGAWDPCNVTEDADLGLRLSRLGYRTGTISYPTYEDAPTNMRVWVPQRTRWFKGWAQTWLVHMRNPRQLMRDLGFFSFMVTQALFPGMLVSALANSALLLMVLGLSAYYFLVGGLPHYYSMLLMLDLFNIVFGYGAFLALGWWSMQATDRRNFWKHVFLTPVYWTFLSFAAWRALVQLYRRPFHWEKTPHQPSRPKKGKKAQCGKFGPLSTIFSSSLPTTSSSRSG